MSSFISVQLWVLKRAGASESKRSWTNWTCSSISSCSFSMTLLTHCFSSSGFVCAFGFSVDSDLAARLQFFTWQILSSVFLWSWSSMWVCRKTSPQFLSLFSLDFSPFFSWNPPGWVIRSASLFCCFQTIASCNLLLGHYQNFGDFDQSRLS